MTLFQIIATSLAAAATIYFSPTVYRKDYVHANMLQVLLWVACVMLCVVSWVGVR